MMATAQKASWYVRREGSVRGPYPPSQISRDTLLGRIRVADELSPDRHVWRTLNELPGLIPEVMRLPDTPGNHERLMLARLRVDERLHDRRTGHRLYSGSDRRRGDRRNVESFAAQEFQARSARDQEETEERNLLLPAAVVLTIAFSLAMYFFWYRPDIRRPISECRAVAAPAVNWSGCNLDGIRVEGADLHEANLANTILSRADLRHSDLHRADLSYADLEGAKLDGANLREARLRGAVLRGASLDGSNLRDADLSFAILDGAKLDRAILDGARFDNAVWKGGRVCAADSVGECRPGPLPR